jgi:hypothetical protein
LISSPYIGSGVEEKRMRRFLVEAELGSEEGEPDKKKENTNNPYFLYGACTEEEKNACRKYL